MDLKSFYLNELFSGYTNNMPHWLEKIADQEIKIIDHLLTWRYLDSNIPFEQSMLDIGCGDCRIFKKIDATNLFKRTAMDIFTLNELPQQFKDYLTDNNIKYKTIGDNNNYYLKGFGETFNIITSLGVDVHLNTSELEQYFYMIRRFFLKENSCLIWQTLREYTPKALLLKHKDKKLNYITRRKSFYTKYIPKSFDLELIREYKTPMTRIFVYKKNSLYFDV